MIDNDISALTRKLEDLRLERDRINQEESQLIEQIRRASSHNDNQTPSVEPSASNGNRQTTESFVVGQRVLIANRLTHVPSSRRITIKDRAATVTGVTRTGKVKIKTYSGHETWRNPGNLRELTDEAHNRIIDQTP